MVICFVVLFIIAIFSSCLSDRPPTVVAGMESHKQSWQSLDKHVMTAVPPEIRTMGARDREVWRVEGYMNDCTT